MKIINKITNIFDARDLFVFIGLALLFAGVGERFGYDWSMIVIGGIIVIKGLTKWV
jgi:hypothetical protein